VTAILARPPAQAPGTFVYSNAGYMIAGAALEKTAGAPWEQLVRDELFAKLGMTSCGFGAPGSKDVVDQPRGHDAGGAPIDPGLASDNPRGLGPAGTVHCSLEDYGKFLAVHATGEPALVEPETMQHLQTARSFGYAGGWMVVTKNARTLLMHSGSNTMWYVTAVVVPADKLAFVIATNKGSDGVEGMLDTLLPRYAKR
jgi:CubicO group peptidase (beta-lactamase class C family)